jgi:hypothetical protein
MPWYAQRAGLPDTHKLWADPGSQHEAVLQQIRYVEVAAPGQTVEPAAAEEPGETPVEPADPPPPVPSKPRGKARS